MMYDKCPHEVDNFAKRWLQFCEEGQALFGYFGPFEHMFDRDYLEEKIWPAFKSGDAFEPRSIFLSRLLLIFLYFQKVLQIQCLHHLSRSQMRNEIWSSNYMDYLGGDLLFPSTQIYVDLARVTLQAMELTHADVEVLLPREGYAIPLSTDLLIELALVELDQCEQQTPTKL